MYWGSCGPPTWQLYRSSIPWESGTWEIKWESLKFPYEPVRKLFKDNQEWNKLISSNKTRSHLYILLQKIFFLIWQFLTLLIPLLESFTEKVNFSNRFETSKHLVRKTQIEPTKSLILKLWKKQNKKKNQNLNFLKYLETTFWSTIWKICSTWRLKAQEKVKKWKNKTFFMIFFWNLFFILFLFWSWWFWQI